MLFKLVGSIYNANIYYEFIFFFQKGKYPVLPPSPQWVSMILALVIIIKEVHLVLVLSYNNAKTYTFFLRTLYL